jgi:hypothetical protein
MELVSYKLGNFQSFSRLSLQVIFYLNLSLHNLLYSILLNKGSKINKVKNTK